MKTKIFYRSIIFVFLIVSAIFLTSCKEKGKEGLKYSAETYVLSAGDYNVATVIDSTDELREADEECGGWFLGEKGKTINADLYEKMKCYDEKFFEKKEIVLVAMTEYHYVERKFIGAELVDERIEVTVEKPAEDAFFMEVMTSYVFIIELDRSVGKRDVAVKFVTASE